MRPARSPLLAAMAGLLASPADAAFTPAADTSTGGTGTLCSTPVAPADAGTAGRGTAATAGVDTATSTARWRAVIAAEFAP